MSRIPGFVVLTPRAARAILRRNHVGRMAFTHGREVDIEPIGYVAGGDWLYMRSAPGTKLDALARRPYVAFEVDEVEGPYDWRSVVVHGSVYRLPVDGSPSERRLRRRAVSAFRKLSPTAFGPRDPVPERRVVFGVHIDRADGRAAGRVLPRRKHAY
jgi:nitroimidazol reductase NimA-like FMN-containing flavoprotein (pyridoxamine 5'-phosphate oxidase superfamily)